jgi:hypothetical protein
MTFKEYLEEKAVQVIPKAEGGVGYFVDGNTNINDTGWKSGYVELNTSKIGDAKYDFQVFDQIENFNPDLYKGRNVSEGSLRWVNLARPQFFDWVEGPEDQKGKSIITMEFKVGKKTVHHFCTRFEFRKPFGLIYYPKKDTEPRSRPTFRGGFTLGKQIGKIYWKSSKQTHPVYDLIKT